jgi:hypothetical protein
VAHLHPPAIRRDEAGGKRWAEHAFPPPGTNQDQRVVSGSEAVLDA